MLSYQHSFHAGGFSDILKHTVLSMLLSYMTQKEKPLFYLETHSGRGLYDLKSVASEKTKEYEVGISKLWLHREVLPKVFSPYLEVCELLNPGEKLRFYPGSPLLAIHLLRAIDRLYCCELHPQEFNALRRLSKQGRRVHYAHTDGIEQLQALLPPKERRGLIFIDPSFEMKAEYKTIPEALSKAYQRFKTGIYCIWYPILDEKQHAQWIRRLLTIGVPALQIEWSLKGLPHAMHQCGVWVLNPPYLLASEVKTVLSTLQQYFESEIFIKQYS